MDHQPSYMEQQQTDQLAQASQDVNAHDRLGPTPETDGLTWSASEYIEHEKRGTWYVGLGIITAVLLLVAIFLLKEFTFALLVVVMATAVVVFARRPAQEVQYRLTPGGVEVNGKPFPYHSFRAFGMSQEGAIYTAVLLPNRRFAPGVTLHFSEELAEQIVDILESMLPVEDVQPDFIDRVTRRLNF